MLYPVCVQYDLQVVTGAVPIKNLQLLHSPQLEKWPWLLHGFSTRVGGVSRAYGGNALNLGFTKDDSRRAVERNREILLKKLGAATGQKSWPLVALRQVHSDLIHRVDRLPAKLLVGDGLITDTPEL